MIPTGCTVKNFFTTPYPAEEIAALRITYQQRGKTVVEKDLEDCTIEEGRVCVVLQQEDTLLFDPNEIVYIQLRVRLTNNVVTKSNIISERADKVLNKEVI